MQTVRERADPETAVASAWWRGEQGVRTFRMSWLRLYAILAVAHVLAFVVICALQHTLVPMIFVRLIRGALLLDAVAAIVVALCFTVRIGPIGIQGHNFWSVRTRMRWKDIEAVEPSRLLGLPWLKIRGRGTPGVMWLPLFFSRRRAFVEALAQAAPDSDPVRKAAEASVVSTVRK
jgi:hypothetical protein